ncbi:hypothetical protein BDV12DRAFT_206669 [Aspergillus spectabilis]
MIIPPLVSFNKAGDSTIEDLGQVSLVGATIVVDKYDFRGVLIAATSLAQDIARVSKTDIAPVLSLAGGEGYDKIRTETAVIIGTIESSLLIRQLIEGNLINVQDIQGRWECFSTAVVKLLKPSGGLLDALVIVGSDKRGAMFGAYTVCEQIGVSPWHWWSDVPVKHHPDTFAQKIATSSQEPSIKFRGIFINDESPSLTGLVIEKFGKYNKVFYIHVFDLLLRLKANFIWPAMWPGYPASDFFLDDPENQSTADTYGIVMSTSHHEPMQRLSNEWFSKNPEGSWDWIDNKEKITRFFEEGVTRAGEFESYFTLGMRGEYDRSMKTNDPAKVVNEVMVIQTQRGIFKKYYGEEGSVPQLLALYKETQGYWDAGRIDIPEDVTLLFADDNYGSLRRLPSSCEATRKGGAGIYYHFEYVGVPKATSNSLGKTWQQLQEAYRRHARQIWIFNVGDIKPMEIPFTFAMSLAWDINSVTVNSIPQFYQTLADQTFGAGLLAKSITIIWGEYHRLVDIRRHEHIDTDTFSLIHYNEATRILSQWRNLLQRTESLHMSEAAEEYKPAFYELVLHPVKATEIYLSVRIRLPQNRPWASQRRTTTNAAAQDVLRLFDADFDLSQEYHALLGGKWNHIMDQTHYDGYGELWHTPIRDMISGLCFVQTRQASAPMVGQLGVAVEGHAGIRSGLINEASDINRPSRGELLPGVTLGALTSYGPSRRWIELYSRGRISLAWHCKASHPWIELSKSSGHITPGQDDKRIYVSVNWMQVPADFHGYVAIESFSTGSDYGVYGDDYETLHLPVINQAIDPSTVFDGYVESDDVVSIPATQATSGTEGYLIHPGAGRIPEGLISVHPAKLHSIAMGEPPFLAYSIYVFNHHSEATLHLDFNMTLDLDPNHRLVDDVSQPGDLPLGWCVAVMDLVWGRKHVLKDLRPGKHTLKIRLLHSNILLEKLLLDLGGFKPSYLGPPTSSRHSTK